MHRVHFVLLTAGAGAAWLGAVALGGEGRATAATGTASTATSDAGRADALAGKLKRTELQNSPSSIPGRNIVQVRTEIPPGVESGWHVHPGEEVGYIVVGSVEMRVAGRPTVVLRAGAPFLIPPGVPHNARDLGPETGQMLSTYLVQAGQPLSSLVPPPADSSGRR
jgi:quercetin dioxygenase-like cupin family protein